MDNKSLIVLFCVLAVVAVALFLYFKFFKIPKLKNVMFVDGSLGTGKSYYSVALAIKLYRREHFRWRISKLFKSVFGFMPRFKDMVLEEPVLCSNIYLRFVPFVPLKLEVILRQERLPYKSVLLIDEASLLADQMLFKDKRINDALGIFFKLFRHENHGGYLVVNSQSTSDMHFTFKSVLSDYLYIHSRVKFPFVSMLRVQEMAYSSDKDGGAIVNANVGDLEDSLKMVLVRNKYYKCFDTYCFSIFTDGLPIYRKMKEFGKGDSLKSADLVTFRDWDFIREWRQKREEELALIGSKLKPQEVNEND